MTPSSRTSRRLSRHRTGAAAIVLTLFATTLTAGTAHATTTLAGDRSASAPPTRNEQRALINFGTVKWFNDVKGYGFITPDDGTQDVFVHHSNIIGPGYRTLDEGQRVEYQVRQGPKGPEAINVLPLP